VDEEGVRAAHLLRLSLACALLSTGCGGAAGEPRPSPTPAASEGELAARAFGRELGADQVRLRPGRRAAALDELAPDGPRVGGDGPVVVATYRGRLVYGQARNARSRDKTVRGRFAFALFDPGTGRRLDLGIYPTAP
jgi:hypothetical protein